MSKLSLPIQTFSLINECALCFNTGLINRKGSPFAQLRRMHPELGLPTKRETAIITIHDKLVDNYRLPKYFLTTYRQVVDGKRLTVKTKR